jgi:hypothetical protein
MLQRVSSCAQLSIPDMPVDKQTKFHSISLANLKLANQTSQLHGTTSQGQTNNIDQIRLPRTICLIQQQASLQPLGVRLLSGTYVNWRATNIDETICVKSGNQQDQTLAGKVNEYADPDKRCRSKRENCCCHTLTPS